MIIYPSINLMRYSVTVFKWTRIPAWLAQPLYTTHQRVCNLQMDLLLFWEVR